MRSSSSFCAVARLKLFTAESRLACESIAPLGLPVVPEV
jgi:hypothetical protein